MANTTPAKTEEHSPPAPQDAKAKREAQAKEKADREKALDDKLRKQATGGEMTDELKEKILALGGDASRASPDITQPLGDPPRGLTTTTGTYRSPMDPTTAAVPLTKDEVDKQAPKGYPALPDKKNDKAA